jgi:hypothetical protein
LIHALEGSPDRDVVLEFDGYLMVHEGFEEAVHVELVLSSIVGSKRCQRTEGYVPEEEHFCDLKMSRKDARG